MTEQNEVHVGTNRTGAALAPERIEAMIAGTEEFYPSSEGDGSAIIAVRAEYAQEAEPIGTVPPPATLKGIAKTAFKALKGGEPTLFLDKLGERLAFERTGTRLYEALLGKIVANGPVAVALAIEAVDHGMHATTEDALRLESNLFGLLASTADMKEGMAAFLEKRKAAFTGA